MIGGTQDYMVFCMRCLKDMQEEHAMEVQENETGDKFYFCEVCWTVSCHEFLDEDEYTCSAPY